VRGAVKLATELTNPTEHKDVANGSRSWIDEVRVRPFREQGRKPPNCATTAFLPLSSFSSASVFAKKQKSHTLSG
jgi:hypothetical protein